MKVYSYDPITKIYTGESVADLSPLEEDVYLIPANATHNPVPATTENEYAVWEGDKWSVKKIVTPIPTPEEIQARTNDKARMYLAQTDWYVTRFAETGAAIPAEISAARAEARASIVE